MRLGYTTYAEASSSFSWDEAWAYVDGTEAAVNATAECLDRHEGTALHVAFEDGHTASYTFETLARRAAQFANLLADLGVAPGDRVAIMLDPSVEFVAAFFGTMKHGAVAVPCSELFGPDALRFRLEDSGASVLVTSPAVSAAVDVAFEGTTLLKDDLVGRLDGYAASYAASTTAADAAWLQYTSGTTGTPTPVPYDHRSVVQFAPIMDLALDFHPHDVCFTTSSTGWGTGIWIGLFAPLVLGVTTGFYSGRFDADVTLDALETFDVNVLLGVVPTAYRRLLDAAADRESVPTVEKANYVGEPISERLSREVEATFGAFPRSIYGATEVRSIITMDYAFPDYELRHGSMGKPVLGLEVTVVDPDGAELPPGEVGTIAVRRGGETILTSDAGYRDADGYFWSAGRRDDTIISAGYTIGPQEVEGALRSHPRVAEVGVVGVPDDERGQVVKAFVEPVGVGDEALRRELRTYVRDQLSKHEYPREIEFVDAVPRTPDGKIKRAELQRRE
jgi:acetyl-CoA synthetase